MPFPLIPLLIGVLIAGTVTTLAIVYWDDILAWFRGEKTNYNDYGELVKHRLANGKYKIVGGVFSNRGIKKSEHVWETEQLDNELQRKFSYSNKIRI